jgi:hypothetical protein
LTDIIVCEANKQTIWRRSALFGPLNSDAHTTGGFGGRKHDAPADH